jgi:hypothetical protein
VGSTTGPDTVVKRKIPSPYRIVIKILGEIRSLIEPKRPYVL